VTDFVVIGGGMAGVSAAAHLSAFGSVVLLEAEQSLAFHTTGRSAAVYVVNYGAQGTRPLAAASREFLESPPEGSTDGPLLSDRGLLWIADANQAPLLDAVVEEATIPGHEIHHLEPADALQMVPALRPEKVGRAMFEPTARDIDVALLHQAYVRIARRNGAEIRTGAPVTTLKASGGRWTITAGGDTFECGAVVNACGAWGDMLAALGGVEPLGLQPMRRTAFMVPGSEAFASWPMVIDVEHRFYFKPDGVQILCSLAEENPDDPGDPKPRMEDVALALERINESTTLDIRSVNSSWTGLRTFAPDRELVIGEDPTAPGFFWLVGLGGIGIATSPGYGALLAALATGSEPSAALTAAGVDPTLLSPARFRQSR
jgi:D-arginine dehydrogenase